MQAAIDLESTRDGKQISIRLGFNADLDSLRVRSAEQKMYQE